VYLNTQQMLDILKENTTMKVFNNNNSNSNNNNNNTHLINQSFICS